MTHCFFCDPAITTAIGVLIALGAHGLGRIIVAHLERTS